MSRRARRARSSWALLLVLVAARVAAQAPAWTALPERWRRPLAAIDERLRTGDLERARRDAAALERDLARRSDLDDTGAQALALACALRAAAEAGLGHGDDALWTWRTAAAIDPSALRLDLEGYGDAARRLGETRFREGHAAAAAEGETGISAPRPERRSRPRYPRSLAFLGVDIEYGVQVVVGTDGRPREPRLVRRPSYPGLVHDLLEAVRRWEFTPARRGGEPVEALYTVSTPFDLP